MAAKLITIEGDVFLASEITTIEVVEKTLSLHLRQFTSAEERFDFEFKTEADARAAQLGAVTDWRNAIA